MTSARPLSFALFARLELPEFSALARKATESVTISLDSSLLELAGRFLDASDPQDAAAKEVLKGLQGIDLERLHKLEGQFGVPKLDIDLPKAPGSGPQK